MAIARPRRKKSAVPHAVLDVGSNSIRLLVAHPAEMSVRPIHEEGEFVRLGHAVDRTGVLQPDREKAALRAIERLADRAKALGAEQVVAVATSAVREAENGPRFIRRVRTRTGIDLQVLSGHREAEMVYLGATLGMPLAGPTLIVDLGGGSAEVIGADRDGLRWARSLPLGCGRLTDRLIAHDPPANRELAAVEEYVLAVLDDLPAMTPEKIILTGGTANRIARLLGSDKHLTPVKGQQLDRLLRLGRKCCSRTLVRRYRMRTERAAVFAAGVCVLRAIVQAYGAPEVVVTRSGFREGTLIDSLRGGDSRAS
jgi:exopolyphosphatase/guanosine-5'-triphosphate,3'-diphosphate pyrophosphatase